MPCPEEMGTTGADRGGLERGIVGRSKESQEPKRLGCGAQRSSQGPELPRDQRSPRVISDQPTTYALFTEITSWLPGAMVARLASIAECHQKVAGSSPAVVMFLLCIHTWL